MAMEKRALCRTSGKNKLYVAQVKKASLCTTEMILTQAPTIKLSLVQE